MNRQDLDNRTHTRGTVLVSSNSSLFVEILSAMVTECGFTPISATDAATAWLSLSQGQLVLVICDGSAPGITVWQLVEEILARRLPLLMVGAPNRQSGDLRGLHVSSRAAQLVFPITREAFREAVEALMRPATETAKRLAVVGADVTADAGIAIQSLDDAVPEGRRATEERRPVVIDRRPSRAINLLP